jgi:hypothetical protein
MIGQPTLDLDLAEPEHDHRIIGACPVKGCKHTRALPGSRASEATAHRCPKHNRPLRWERVDGHYSPGIKCNASCQFARRPWCECSCAGKNHARGWIS